MHLYRGELCVLPVRYCGEASTTQSVAASTSSRFACSGETASIVQPVYSKVIMGCDEPRFREGKLCSASNGCQCDILDVEGKYNLTFL